MGSTAATRRIEVTAKNCDDDDMIPKTALQCSHGAAKTVHGSHVLEISGYSLYRERLRVPVRVSSAVFAAGGYDWQIYFFPGGVVLDCFNDYVGAYLVLKSENEDLKVRATFQISLVDITGSTPPYTVPGTYEFGSGSSMCSGHHNFKKRSDLEASPYLHDDRLTIECAISIVKDVKSPEVQPSDIIEHLGRSKSSLHFGSLVA